MSILATLLTACADSPTLDPEGPGDVQGDGATPTTDDVATPQSDPDLHSSCAPGFAALGSASAIDIVDVTTERDASPMPEDDIGCTNPATSTRHGRFLGSIRGPLLGETPTANGGFMLVAAGLDKAEVLPSDEYFLRMTALDETGCRIWATGLEISHPTAGIAAFELHASASGHTVVHERLGTDRFARLVIDPLGSLVAATVHILPPGLDVVALAPGDEGATVIAARGSRPEGHHQLHLISDGPSQTLQWSRTRCDALAWMGVDNASAGEIVTMVRRENAIEFAAFDGRGVSSWGPIELRLRSRETLQASRWTDADGPIVHLRRPSLHLRAQDGVRIEDSLVSINPSDTSTPHRSLARFSYSVSALESREPRLLFSVADNRMYTFGIPVCGCSRNCIAGFDLGGNPRVGDADVSCIAADVTMQVEFDDDCSARRRDFVAGSLRVSTGPTRPILLGMGQFVQAYERQSLQPIWLRGSVQLRDTPDDECRK